MEAVENMYLISQHSGEYEVVLTEDEKEAIQKAAEQFDKDNKGIRDVICEQNIIFRWILYFGLIFGIIIFGIYGSGYNAGAFVYGQF